MSTTAFAKAIAYKDYNGLSELLSSLDTDIEHVMDDALYWALTYEDKVAVNMLIASGKTDTQKYKELFVLWEFRSTNEMRPGFDIVCQECVMNAVRNHTPRIVKLTLKWAPARNKNTLACVNTACEVGRLDIVTMLAKDLHYEDLDTCITTARRHRQEFILQFLEQEKLERKGSK